MVIDVFLEFPIHRNTIFTFLEDNLKKNSMKVPGRLLKNSVYIHRMACEHIPRKYGFSILLEFLCKSIEK